MHQALAGPSTDASPYESEFVLWSQPKSTHPPPQPNGKLGSLCWCSSKMNQHKGLGDQMVTVVAILAQASFWLLVVPCRVVLAFIS